MEHRELSLAILVGLFSLTACSGGDTRNADAAVDMTRPDFGGRPADGGIGADAFLPTWSCADPPCVVEKISLTGGGNEAGATYLELENGQLVVAGNLANLLLARNLDLEELSEGPMSYAGLDALAQIDPGSPHAFGLLGTFCGTHDGNTLRCLEPLIGGANPGLVERTFPSVIESIHLNAAQSWGVVLGEDRVVRFFDLIADDMQPVRCDHDSTVFCDGEPLFENAKQVVVGASHICALHQDGTVSCLSDDRFTRLDYIEGRSWETEVVAGLNDITQISANAEARGTCALRSDGKVFCWGAFAAFVEDCDAPAGPPGCWKRLHEVAFPVGVTKIASGMEQVCGLVDGALYCAGNNRAGQVGNGTFLLVETPVQVIDDVRDFAVGRLHVCAIKNDRHVFCWGDNEEAQLGDGRINAYICLSRGGAEYGCQPSPSRMLGF